MNNDVYPIKLTVLTQHPHMVSMYLQSKAIGLNLQLFNSSNFVFFSRSLKDFCL